MVATAIVLVLLIVKFRGSGLVLAVSIFIMSVLNWAIFAWPLWAAVVVGIGLFWGMTR